MRDVRLIVVLSLWIAASIVIHLLGAHDHEEQVITMELTRKVVNCSDYLERVDLPFPALLIDEELIRGLSRNECAEMQSRIRLAVDVQLVNSLREEDYRAYEIVHYEDLAGKDYLQLYDLSMRIIPRITFNARGNLSIPQDKKRFLEFWKRSKLVQCRGLEVVRKQEDRYLPLQTTLQAMSSFASYLTEFDIYPFLFCGTLLGWFRECDIIPHTKDVDFGALIEEHNPDLLKHLLSNETKFNLWRVLGRVNDSYEFTLKPLSGGPPNIDLFWMYSAENESWVGGTAGNGTKFKYTYPRYNETCAADLHGHIFWITCYPEETLLMEYGSKWYIDHPSSNFSWSSSQFNVRRNGKWAEAEMKSVYRLY